MTKKRKLSENNENNIVKKTRKDINNIYKFNMYPDNYEPIGYANITKIILKILNLKIFYQDNMIKCLRKEKLHLLIKKKL